MLKWPPLIVKPLIRCESHWSTFDDLWYNKVNTI
jgi:hypothetical protein